MSIINLLDDIDTTGVEMATWAYQSEVTELREDVVDHLITKEDVHLTVDGIAHEINKLQK